MFNPNKIDAKYLASILITVIVLPIIFANFGMKVFFMLAILFLFLFSKKSFRNFNLLFNFFKENNMVNQMASFGDYSSKIGGVWKITKIILLALLAIRVVSWFVVIIGPGETGVYVLFGKVDDQELSSGFHFVNPLAKIEKMNIRTEQYTMSVATNEGQKTGNDTISALTKEGLSVDIDFTALYHLDESKASDIYRELA